MRRPPAIVLATCLLCLLTAAGCSGGGTALTTTTSAPPTSATTTIPTPTTVTTVTTTTSTTQPGEVDLSLAVLRDGDPWPEAVAGSAFRAIGVDLTADPATYTAAGFQEGATSYFRWTTGSDQWGDTIATGAYRFADQAGAEASLAALQSEFGYSPMTLALTGDLQGDALTAIAPWEVPTLGDQSTGLIGTGPEYQVLVAIWRTGTIVQYAYASMPLNDEAHSTALIALVQLLEQRVLGG
jgi:hypothetical protein